MAWSCTIIAHDQQFFYIPHSRDIVIKQNNYNVRVMHLLNCIQLVPLISFPDSTHFTYQFGSAHTVEGKQILG